MANYTVLPLTDSFSVQRCLTWQPPPPQMAPYLSSSQPNLRTRPTSAPVAQRLHPHSPDNRRPVMLKPSETSVSRAAPYAPRLIDCHFYSPGPVPIGSASMNAFGSEVQRFQRRDYSAINDPHLYDFFVRKFSNMERLTPALPDRDTTDGAKDSAKKKKNGKPKHGKAVYKVAVKTGDKKNAGTRANVYLTVIGSKSKLPKRRLVKKPGPNSKRDEDFEFKKSSTHVFKFDGADVGNVESIIIEHDGVTEEDSWYLDQVEICKKSPSTGKEKSWIFVCRNWLSLYEGDCQVRRQLYQQHSSKTEYEIVTVTGNVKGAGTDANVFITLFGKTGQTPKLQLKNSSNENQFERNQSDIFVLKTKCCGPLTKIRLLLHLHRNFRLDRVGLVQSKTNVVKLNCTGLQLIASDVSEDHKIQHDNTGFGPGWFLDRVVVTDLNNPRWKFYFPCGAWLAKDEGDGLICRDLVGSNDPLGVRKVNRYKLIVFTGDKRGAGTDANVSVTLFGELGDSGERRLDTKRKNNFERNQKDEFIIESPSLGKLSRLRIGHDNSGPSPGWFLDKVIVDDMDNSRVYEFPCNRWLAKDEDDGQISRDLTCRRSSLSTAPGVPYTLHVKTGDVPNADTSAGVYIIMYGGKTGEKSSGKILLADGKFRRGRTDIINVEVVEMLSPLSRIDIGHDNKGVGPGWFLDEVVINCPSAGIEQTFRCNGWLALDEGDRTIEKTLYPSKTKQKQKMITWGVTVYTADARGAGTDANVVLVIYGKNANGDSLKSDEIRLENKGDCFEVGQVDKFKIEAEDIGKPYKIRVSHDNTGSFPGWKLDQIELENTVTKKMYTFRCGRWLASDEDDGSIFRELPAEGDDIKRPEPVVKYAVKVHTGKKQGAGTDANVFLNIFGSQGDTGERPLTKSANNRNAFEKGNVDEFTIEAVTLKKLKKIRIGHDGSKPGSGWFLDKVVIQPLDDPSAATVFECNRWLDIKEDDGLTVREITAGGSQMLSTTSYHVAVKTGKARGAGTDANVFIKLFGNKGDSGKLQLANSDLKNKFEAGRTDNFVLEATDIGKLQKIRIGHDGSRPGAGWFLDEVVVDIPSKGEKYTFACHRWLDKNEDDGQIEIEIEPTSVDKGAIRIPYEITVWTGDKKGAGTDANVFIQMYGELGKTEEYQLRNRTDNFEQGQTDKFKIEAGDVGPLLKVRIGHDGKGAFAGWYLDKMLIQRHPGKESKRRLKRRASHGRIKDDSRRSVSGRRQLDSDSDGGMSARGHRIKDYQQYDDDDDDYDRKRHDQRRPSSAAGRRPSSATGRRPSSVTGRRDNSDDEYDSRRRPSKANNRFDDSDDDDKRSTASGRRKSSVHDRDTSSAGRRGSVSRLSQKESPRDRRRHSESDEDSSRESGKFLRNSSVRGKDVRSRRSDSEDDLRSTSSAKRRNSTIGNRDRRDDSDSDRRSTRSSDRSKKRRDDDDDDDSSSRLRRRKDSRHDDDDDKRSVRSGKKQRQQDDDDDDDVRNGKNDKRRAADDLEEVEEYWFVCKRWFATNEDDGKIVRELLPTTEDGQPLDTGLTEIEYIVRVYTGDKFGSGTDANVYINITGEFGDTGERHLKDSNNMNKFERNKEDIFKVNAVELGKLKKVKIRHDNKGGGADWYLDRIEIEDPKLRKTYLFPCQNWLATGKGDGQIARELVPHDPKHRGSMKDVALEDKALKSTYHVYVYTGDKFGAGTDANVFVVLYGEIDDTGVVFLKTSKNNKNKFERNQMDEFVIEAVDIGELKKIKIGHDNAGGGGAWFLEKVEIDCPHLGRKWSFPHHKWLAKDKEDGKLERELFPQDMATEEYNPCIPYEITVYTSDIRGAGTEADVYVVLYGQNSCTSKKSLCPNKSDRKKQFERAQAATFVVELEDVGSEIEKLRIGHDGKGFGAGWHLDRVEVRRLKDSGKGSQTYIFPCGRWLDKTEDDGAIERELVANKVIEESVRKDGTTRKKELERRNTLTAKKYTVNVVTGDMRGAGTDANVFLTIFGEQGDSGERQLQKSETFKNKFERNQTDRFTIEAVDLGTLFKIKIRHDDTNFSSDWFLNRVEVIDPDNPEPYVFHCERWLAKKKDDGKIERTIYAKGYKGDMSSNSTMHSRGMTSMASMDSMQSAEPFGKSPRLSRRHMSMEDIPEGPTVPYTVKITTGREKKMGTESNVYIKIIGTKKRHTGKQFLELINKKGFLPGSIETFSLDAVDVGQVTQIELGHDGVTEGSGWYVQEVQVDMPTKGTKYFFKCNSWLAKDQGDGQTSRVFGLDDGDASVVNYKPMIPYEATFYTGDMADAGTDGEVFIQVFGVKGTSSEIKFDKMSERFERGRVDLIKFELEDIAPLKKLRVGHNGKGSRANWYLEKVELRNMATGDLAVFHVDAWLSKTKDDKQLVRDVPATVKGKVTVKPTTYRVSVKTSDVRGAGTDANVFVSIFGENGDSGEIPLKNSETNKKPFENNQVDVFTIPNILALGQLFKVRVWHDNKGFGAAWHLDYIEVEDTSNGQKFMFPCGKWLSKNEDDKQICRELTCSNLPSPKAKGKISYQIDVTTSDKQDAGTQHNAWIILEGDQKTSDEFVMENSARRKILRRGQDDTFTFTTRNLGRLTRCYVGLVENDGVAATAKDATWHCEKITVTNTDTGDQYTFACNDWIKVRRDISKRNAKQLDLKAVEESHISAVKSLGNVKYDVAVFTGNESGSGTNANVFITVYGTNGDTGKRPLTQKLRDLFERGQQDNFQLEAVDLGDLQKVKIEHDNAGFRPGWLLDRVEITNLASNRKWIFPCNQWLDKGKGDGQIARELFPRR